MWQAEYRALLLNRGRGKRERDATTGYWLHLTPRRGIVGAGESGNVLTGDGVRTVSKNDPNRREFKVYEHLMEKKNQHVPKLVGSFKEELPNGSHQWILKLENLEFDGFVTLTDFARKNPRARRDLIAIGHGIKEALYALYEDGVLWNDAKTDNVMVKRKTKTRLNTEDVQYTVKIIDFGRSDLALDAEYDKLALTVEYFHDLSYGGNDGLSEQQVAWLNEGFNGGGGDNWSEAESDAES